MTSRRSGALLPLALAGAGLLALALVTAFLARRGEDPAIGLLLFAGAGVALLLVSHPRAATFAALAGTVVAESSKESGLGALSHFHEAVAGGLSPSELMLLLAVASVGLDAVRRAEAPRLPGPFTVPLALAFGALLAGVLNGALTWASASSLFSFATSLAPLFLVPWLVVNVVRTPHDLRVALGAGAALALVKAAQGLAVAALGTSEAVSPDSSAHLTFYEPAANVLILVVLLAVAAGVLAGARLPRWLLWTSPLLPLALVFSYRRAFWVGSLLALLVTALAATGRLGRRLAVPLAAVVVGVGALVVQSGAFAQLQAPVVERATSIDPSKIQHNEQDRYRLDERRNVLAALREEPVTGLGAGVPWPGRYPVPFDYPFGHTYVHMASLWWWMTMGLLGLLSYGVLVLSAMVVGWRVWRRHPDPYVRVFGLAGAGTVLALALVELTSTVIGPDQRATSVVGALLGLLAVAHASARPAAPTRPADSLGQP
jgi:O-antigen ligase